MGLRAPPRGKDRQAKAGRQELTMNALLQIGLSNAVLCGVMAALLLPLARWLRRPALTHALSVLILLKLFTPPLFNVSVLWNSAAVSAESSVTHSAASSPAHSL